MIHKYNTSELEDLITYTDQEGITFKYNVEGEAFSVVFGFYINSIIDDIKQTDIAAIKKHFNVLEKIIISERESLIDIIKIDFYPDLLLEVKDINLIMNLMKPKLLADFLNYKRLVKKNF